MTTKYKLNDAEKSLMLKAIKAVAYDDDGDPIRDVIDEREMIDAMRLMLAMLEASPAQESEPVAWKDVVGYEGLYEVSSAGDIKNKLTNKILSKNLAGAGYVKADLCKNGVKKQTTVHRVVAQAFIGLDDGMEVNHKDGIKTNNNVSNLEVVTRSQNELHSRYELGNLCKSIVATNIKTGEKRIYPSINSVSKDGFIPSNVYGVCYKKRKVHKGHTWEFVNESDADGLKKTQPPADKDSDQLIYDFAGFLTTRKERLICSSADNASPMVEAIKEFLEIRSKRDKAMKG